MKVVLPGDNCCVSGLLERLHLALGIDPQGGVCNVGVFRGAMRLAVRVTHQAVWKRQRLAVCVPHQVILLQQPLVASSACVIYKAFRIL